MMFADPKEWWLEWSPTLDATAIPPSHQCSTSYRRHWAYLNGLCLHACLNWLREDMPTARSATASNQLPTVWEFVDGTAIAVGDIRLILIPSEAIDISELVVPQEWVDIPSWAGDYYLAVQVQQEQEQGWIRVWGYTTHAELKQTGTYDASDRTYGLEADQLTQDLNALSVTLTFCGAAQPRAAIAPLPELPVGQANALIQRLGQSGGMFPRLALPFPLWAALIEQDSWRQQLWQQRTGQPPLPSVTRLSDWLQGTFSTAWQALEGIVAPPEPVVGWRNRSLVAPPEPVVGWHNRSTPQPDSDSISRVRVLHFGTSPDTVTVALRLSVMPAIASRMLMIDLQVCSTTDHPTLPPGLQLELRDGSGQTIAEVSASSTETMPLGVDGEPGEQFQVVITVGANSVVETFEI
jgi:hypothetical protein